MLKQKIQKIYRLRLSKAIGVSVLVVVLVFGGVPVFRIEAESIQDQIAVLEKENAENKKLLEGLKEQATSYEDALEKLQGQIDNLKGQIDANTAEQRRLQAELELAEEDLIRQKKILGESIKTIYLEGQISTLEMLASSKSLSDFVDKQQYRNSVQSKIKTTLDKITKLKFELTAKREGIDKLLKEQERQQAKLTASHDEQAGMLAFNTAQQEEFNQKTRNNQDKIDTLIAAQMSSNFDPDGGYYFLRFPGAVQSFNPADYPYAGGGFSMRPGFGCVDDDGPDPWGYCTRQCVSYTAWAVLASGRTPPMYYGNARDWVAAAYSRGITVSRSPQAGDVAISTSGFWGHAMYVESVEGNTFTTTEYNAHLTGAFSRQVRDF